jgi:hypothetical protein
LSAHPFALCGGGGVAHTLRENTRAQRKANDAGNNSRERQRQTVTPSQFWDLTDKAMETQISEQSVCWDFRVPSIEMFPVDRFEAAINKLEFTIKARAAHEPEFQNTTGEKSDVTESDHVKNFHQERDNADPGGGGRAPGAQVLCLALALSTPKVNYAGLSAGLPASL